MANKKYCMQCGAPNEMDAKKCKACDAPFSMMPMSPTATVAAKPAPKKEAKPAPHPEPDVQENDDDVDDKNDNKTKPRVSRSSVANLLRGLGEIGEDEMITRNPNTISLNQIVKEEQARAAQQNS